MVASKHHRGHRKHRRHTQKGGNDGGAAGYVTKMFGNGPAQFANTFGPNSPPGNIISPLPGQHGGKRHRHHKHHANGSRSKKGGYWAQVLSNAAVPLALFALNKHYGKSRKPRHYNGARTMKKRN